MSKRYVEIRVYREEGPFETLRTSVETDDNATNYEVACAVGDCIDKHWTVFNHQNQKFQSKARDFFEQAFAKPRNTHPTNVEKS